MGKRKNDKAKLIGVCIPPERADLQVLVGDDGVWLGFFGSDGEISMVNIDMIIHPRAHALKKWADDRRRQVENPLDTGQQLLRRLRNHYANPRKAANEQPST